MQIFVYGNDARLAECRRLLCQAEIENTALARQFRDIHLLPIPSRSVTAEEMRCSFPSAIQGEERLSGEECRGEVNVECLPQKSLVVGYEVPTFFYEMDRVEVFDLAEEEPFLWRNARLCALGMVGILLTEHTRVPSEMRVGIIGYGRIGKEVCDLLTFLETPLVVFTSNQEAVTSLAEKGIASILVDWKAKSLCNVNESLQNNGISMSLDILINTSPAPMGEIFYDGFCGTVYDLASGKPIPERVKHTRLSSLPMRMYAQSAGAAVYRAIVGKYDVAREERRGD